MSHREENESLQVENRRLQQRTRHIEEVLKEFREGNERLHKHCTEIREQNRLLLVVSQNHQEEKEGLQDQNRRLVEQTIQAREVIDGLNEANELLENHCRDIHQQNADLLEMSQNLLEERDELEAQDREHRGQLEACGQTIIEAGNRYMALSDELEATQRAMQVQAEGHERHRQTVTDRTRRRVIELCLTITDLRGQLDTSRAEVADLQTQRAIETENHDLATEYLEGEIEALQQELDERDGILKDAYAARDQAQEEQAHAEEWFQQQVGAMHEDIEYLLNWLGLAPLRADLEDLHDALHHARIVIGNARHEAGIDPDVFHLGNEDEFDGSHSGEDESDGASSQTSGTLVDGSRANSEIASNPEIFEFVTPSPNASPRPYSASPRYSPRSDEAFAGRQYSPSPSFVLAPDPAPRSPSFDPHSPVLDPISPVFAPSSPDFSSVSPVSLTEASSRGRSPEQASRPSQRYRTPTPYPGNSPANSSAIDHEIAASEQDEEIASPQIMRHESVPRAGARRSIEEFQENDGDDAPEPPRKRSRYDRRNWNEDED